VLDLLLTYQRNSRLQVRFHKRTLGTLNVTLDIILHNAIAD